jgi:hypothetical protein
MPQAIKINIGIYAKTAPKNKQGYVHNPAYGMVQLVPCP